MDRAKKARRPVRAQLTKLINECKALLTADPINESSLQVKLQVMETLHSALEEHDTQVVDNMIDEGLDDDAQDLEYQAITDYKESFLEVKLDIEKAIHPNSSPANSDFETASINSDNRKQKNYKLPKIELQKFDGELKNWLGWWSQFQKIHEDDGLHDADKIQYLFQAMEIGSEPKELVCSYPQTAENYPKVVEALKERFGRDDLLLQVYVRELLNLVISNVTATDRISLSSLYTKLESHLRSLAALKLDKELLATILFPLVESSLSVETLRAWQRSQQSKTDGSKLTPPLSRLDLLMDFIKQEVHSEQQIALAQSGFGKLSAAVDDKRKKFKKTSTMGEFQSEEVATAAGLISAIKTGCAFCDKKHDADRCVTALFWSLEERQKKIEEKRVCFRCLRGGHIASKCRAIVGCALCGGKHYPIICPKSSTSTVNTAQEIINDQDNTTIVTASNSNQCSANVLLFTLKVHLIGSEGTVKINIVGDPGSQRSYIQKDIIRQSKCKLAGYEWIQNILFGGETSQPQRSGRYLVPIRNIMGGEVKNFELLEKEVICGRLPCVPNGPWMNELAQKGITFSTAGEGWEDIHVLLGNDYWGDVLTGRMEKLSSGLVAFETVFGWTLGGPIPKIASNLGTVVSTLMTTNLDVSNMWSLEALGITDPIELKSTAEKEQEALSYFKKTVAKDGDRYVVSLPWNDVTLESRPPSNREVAEKRLNNTTKKLLKEGKIQEYHNIFLTWERKGFIVKLQEDDGKGHYLPHRPVFKESTTTPVRPVFDASCKVGHNPSLNDTLHKGPNLLELIPILLLRFRENKIAVSADILKAFQMLIVRAEDQVYQKFLWWEEATCRKLIVYKHLRVVFGMTCSPFLLGAVINHHLDQEEKSSSVTDILRKSYYVDNCLTSVNSIGEYEKFRSEAITIMKNAGMILRQWAHNFSEEFKIGLSMGDGCGLNTGEVDDMDEEKYCISILGLLWNRVEDTLSCDIKEVTAVPKVTKRYILSVVSQIFDPIGFTCPAVLLPKLLLQKSWIVKIGWDEALPEETRKKFIKWKDEMNLLSKIKIPRFIQLPQTSKREIHIFVDASSDFYACVGFLRSEISDYVEVRLLTAKSRLAPIKRASIPRLELMACLIGVRQANMVKSAIPTDDIQWYFWSDSTTALAWIRRNGDWGVFVGNRVKEIRSSTSSDQWNHIPGFHNPADLPSRGCTPAQLLELRWWEGPEWLRLPKQDWPMTQEEFKEEEINKELRATSISTTTAAIKPVQPLFSTYRKCVAVWGWVLRFIRSCQGQKSPQKYLQPQEMNEAETILLKQIQRESFPNGGSTINGIQVFKDKRDLLRVKTKLVNSEDAENFKFPVLLPKAHPLVELLIENTHSSCCHGGVQFLMSKLREKYWILQARRTISKIIHKCVKCKRHQGQPMSVDPAALPEGRVRIQEPFSTTGVDLAGPLTLKDGTKAWIVLYTCAVFRGVHLDLVTSLSTEAFMGSLERFISTCGRPNTIYSDNGTNFVGAVHLFESLDWEAIKERSNTNQIQWIFNPPTAAWWGGFWERLVRSVKGLLKRMLGRSKLTYDQLRTCLAGVAAVVNDRPLTVVTEDNGDLIPLTPNIFMKGQMVGFLEETTEAEFLSKSYRSMKKLQELLHARFRKEYLSQLVMKANEKKLNHGNVGDIVLVGSDGKKRYEWPLGKIEELYPGKDGKVRVAKVKTQGGMLLLQRLYPLEISKQEDVPIVGESKVVPQVKTRLGRVVKAPSRYGQWLHLISN